MKCHQILTGACNVGDKTFGVGSVEGVSLIAYAAGCNITILASSFHRVQIIPGICHNNVQITCVDVSNDTGKIAVAYENKVCVFEPTPLLTRDSLHGLDYWWVQTGQLDLECRLASLAWNHEGTRLLTAGEVLHMWRYSDTDTVSFNIGDGAAGPGAGGTEQGTASWRSIWRVRPPTPVTFLAFSSDGTLFATAGGADRLVRVWYQNQQLLLPGQALEPGSALPPVTYSFIYVAHPRPVTGFSWRDTSRYMPRGAVANMLVTNCKDNICRLWSETVLPDDGLICMQQLDPAAAQDPHFRAHRQKQRFIQRLKHTRQSFAARKVSRAATQGAADSAVQDPIPTLPSTYSIHDFHNFSFQGSGISPGLHFHLSATINAVTDIPLVPAMSSGAEGGGQHRFLLHWLNNKEIHFSLEAGGIMRELAKIALRREDGGVEQEMQEAGERREMRLELGEASGSAGGLSHAPSVTSFSTDISQPSGSGSAAAHLSLSEALDQRIEGLLRAWHQSSDLLFSVHPVDGSLLVWSADFLDEYQPGEFRQAQVSFSSRIPNAIPIGDASTMSSNVTVFNPKHILNLNDLIKDSLAEEEEQAGAEEDEETRSLKPGPTKFQPSKYDASPAISMISKHQNGSLNLWDVTFSPDSGFSQLLNIGHKARVNGHRFRVNDITSHPVLPLLLTTSHHNMATAPPGRGDQAFCSELILWRVASISPLSRPGSGGISELARINSSQVSAFTHVAWVPTLLPSTVLGSLSNSPSACFVSSDGRSLRVYQAVIDARSLLSELNAGKREELQSARSSASLASEPVAPELGPPELRGDQLRDLRAKLVSAQSSFRPGAVIELASIAGSSGGGWQSTLLLHTFQAEMVHSSSSMTAGTSKLGLFPASVSAMVDLRPSSRSGFSETFFVVLAEGGPAGGVTMHMWQLELASPGEEGERSGAGSPEAGAPGGGAGLGARLGAGLGGGAGAGAGRVCVTSSKVCTAALPLPAGTEVVQCVPAAGHLSSSSIYPACLAPYLLATACSDQTVRFWCASQPARGADFAWSEWRMEGGDAGGSSAITVPGAPVSLSAAYSGRIAVAYRAGAAFHRKAEAYSEASYVNLAVAIYECESTGGSQWVLEDRILLRNVEVPRVELALDRTVFQPQERREAAMARLQARLYEPGRAAEQEGSCRLQGGLAKVPSRATIGRLQGAGPLDCPGQEGCTQLPARRLVQLDWVSNEDGSHILTVAVADRVMLLTTVSSELAQANMQQAREARIASSQPAGPKRPLLRRSSSIGLPAVVDEWRWMTFRRIQLRTADGLPPLPMAVRWARDGVLLCAMENEVAVYSQWRGEEESQAGGEEPDHRCLKDEDLLSLAQESQLRNVTSGGKLASGANMKYLSEAEDKARESQLVGLEDLMPDVGLFEASHLACPVLPQYHPKQLMELLNSGKIRWVKAILSHLAKCIAPEQAAPRPGGRSDPGGRSPRDWDRGRSMERSPSPKQRSSTTHMPEEVTLDYSEIRSVPPLPLWTLLAADKEKGNAAKAEKQDEYNELFETEGGESELTLDFSLDDEPMGRAERRMSVAVEKQGLSYFGPRQARLLSKLLTHTQLPGLTSLDQMHLLALADTVASCNIDLAERFAIDAAKSAINKESLSTVSAGETSLESLDDCGLRCLLAMKNHCYLKRFLPIGQRAALGKQGLNTSNIIWGFHSESEEELVSLVPGVSKGTVAWPELRELGVVWWTRSNQVLRRLVERLAKASFQRNNDPLDAALYYLAMKKKSLVWGLFRSMRDEKMTQFFNNNFAEERWRKAALKNAFALLGKQRFLHSAAFFLLSGSLKDAIEIIINKMEDIQLAILVGRLYEGVNDNNPPCVEALLKKHVLGISEETGAWDRGAAHPDPFLRSIGFWIIRDYEASLTTLVQTGLGENHPKFQEDESVILRKKPEVDPSVFNFYVYLRTHPLIMRQRVARRSEDKSKALMLSGFKTDSNEKATTFSEDAVTPLERRLFFTTAHFHLRSGCPALALEVLNKLPANLTEERVEPPRAGSRELPAAAHLETGRLDEETVDWSRLGRVSPPRQPDKAKEVKEEELGGLDWGAPARHTEEDADELKLEWSDNDDDEDDDDEEDVKKVEQRQQSAEEVSEEAAAPAGPVKTDIMAQQLKFMACLKIMMEELSTIATGFELEGGIIRSQLYVWLEKEVEALTELCNYGGRLKADTDLPVTEVVIERDEDWRQRPSLHQVILHEKADLETRLARSARRKKWLLANQTLLRTLLSYCGLHGANGGGLACVGMELVLLLQELQQEQTQTQLLSPLPFPTTLPLLSACIAQQKTVVIDPIHHLQTLSHDMLHRLATHRALPAPGTASYSSIFLVRDLAVALSSCVYQSMCDSDTATQRRTDLGLPEAVSRLSVVMADSFLMFPAGPRKQSCSTVEEEAKVSTEPARWPGVTALRTLLDRDKDEDTPSLAVLLCEMYSAVYLALLVYGLATCDSHILYRLVTQRPTGQVWSQIFGGGSRKVLSTVQDPSPGPRSAHRAPSEEAQDPPDSLLTSGLNTVTSITKQRIKLNMKLLNVQLGSSPPDAAAGEKAKKATYKELFVPPEVSIVSKLMSKTALEPALQGLDYDSDQEGEAGEAGGDAYDDYDDEDDDPFSNVPPRAENCEHSSPDSYAWAILRLAVLHLAQKNIEGFLSLAGLELAELPITSTLIYRCLRTTELWSGILVQRLTRDGKPPDNFIPGCFPDSTAAGPLINKYRAMLEPQNTPFPSAGPGLGPIKRLWRFLIHQESLQCVFIRYIFGRSRPAGSSLRGPEEAEGASRRGEEESVANFAPGDEREGKLRTIHKEQDGVTAFCSNRVSPGLIALSTPREILEVNMHLLLHPSAWSDRADDEAENDILHMQEASGAAHPPQDFKPPPGDPFQFMSGLGSGGTSLATSPSGSQPGGPGSQAAGVAGQATRASHVVKRHRSDGVRRLAAHPHLPLYISGGQDGAVAIWEWSHATQVATVRPAGVFAKVNRIVFTQQGNKFGLCDGDGNTALWQASSTSAPYFSMNTHNRNTADFVFLGGSSSLLATAGHAGDGRNVALWDTLLPHRKACTAAFNCHDAGAACLAHATQHQLLLSAGKKGAVCIWDLRQGRLMHTFRAHEHAVKCIAMDSNETMFVTGSADGDIKVWDLTAHRAIQSYPAEHARHGLFKNISQGVAQVSLDDGLLYSCGADGSIKMRRLPEREVYVNARDF